MAYSWKLIGGLLVVAGGAAWGQLKASALEVRHKNLIACDVALDVMSTEMGSAHLRAAEVFKRVSQVVQGNVGRAFAVAATAGDGCDPGTALLSALTGAEGLQLTEDDLAVLQLLGSYLGVVDRREQVRQLRVARERLKIQVSAAREQQRRYGGLFRYLGVMIGVGLVVVLI